MKNKITYSRNESGEFAGKRKRNWIVPLIVIGLLLTGVTRAWIETKQASQKEKTLTTEEKKENCVKENNTINCDLTDAVTKEKLNLLAKKGITWYSEKEIIQSVEQQEAVSKFKKLYPRAKEDVLKTIVLEAQKQAYNDLDFLMALIDCESKFDPFNVNSRGNNPSWSVDRGLTQWNSHWQKKVSNECAFDAKCAVEKTIMELKAGRSHLWACTPIAKKRIARG